MVLFLISLVALWWQRKQLHQIREQVAVVERDNSEFRRIKLDSEEILKAQIENSELEKLRRDNADVHRLRNEIRRLREETKDFQRVRAENERLRLQTQLTSANASSAIEPSPGLRVDAPRPGLYSRTFKLGPAASAVVMPTPDTKESGEGRAKAFKDFLTKAGVEIEAPKSYYFQNQTGQLFVRATQDDLEAIEKAITDLNSADPEAH